MKSSLLVSPLLFGTGAVRRRFGKIPFLVLVAALAPLLCCAQGLITTVAGSTGVFPPVVNGGLAINAPLASVSGVAVDSAGNIFVADSQDNMVAKIAPDGSLTVIAGNRGVGFSGDGGLAVNAQLDNPGSLAVDAAGNLYIAVLDRIRRVTPAGIISTVAGNGQGGSSGDGGPATSAQLSGLGGVAAAIAVDSAGNLYIADSGNYRIRQVTPDGTIRTIAGTGQLGFSGDGGPATSAQFNFPRGIAVDVAGNLYVADTGNNRIRKVVPGGVISTVAGSGQLNSSAGFSGDGGPAINAQLDYPLGLAVDAVGNLYISDSGNGRIRKVVPGGAISSVAGGGPPGSFAGFSGDGGAALHSVVNHPVAVSIDAAGDLYIADSMNSRIREINPVGIISTVAGNGGVFLGDGGPAASAELTYINGVATDVPGNLYERDSSNCISRASIISLRWTVAGMASKSSYCSLILSAGEQSPSRRNSKSPDSA
jgi:sugar lactone lactonase YvrE